MPASMRAAWAQAPATIGTFPAGVGADSVFVGITVPITGAYSADGQDLQRGYQLALDLINAGDPLAANGAWRPRACWASRSSTASPTAS